jgi:hypothetical protein
MSCEKRQNWFGSVASRMQSRCRTRSSSMQIWFVLELDLLSGRDSLYTFTYSFIHSIHSFMHSCSLVLYHRLRVLHFDRVSTFKLNVNANVASCTCTFSLSLSLSCCCTCSSSHLRFTCFIVTFACGFPLLCCTNQVDNCAINRSSFTPQINQF